MPEWSTACLDWEDRLLAGKSLIPFAPLFPNEAEEALGYFRDLRIVDAPGSPTIGEVCKPWVFDFVRAVFGSCDPETGRRLIRYFLLLIAKKNSKSTTAAGIGITFLLRNWRASAEALILAPTIEVAGNSFQPARDMIRADDELSEILHVQDHIRTITHRETKATLKVVAADNETVSGKKASLVIIDELWLFGKRANAENMLREATGGLASRPEGMVIYLSTQSDQPPAGVFAQILAEFRGVRDGKIHDPRSLGVLYEYPTKMLEAEAFRDPDTWHLTNPNLGASVDIQYLLDEQGKAERAGAASFRSFAAKHLNVEIGIALRSDGWAGAPIWDRGIEAGLTFEAILARSEAITIGIDGGGLDDLLGIAVLGRERATRTWLLWTHAFISPDGEERRKANSSVYENFKADGDLTLVEALPDDLEAVVEIVRQVKATGRLAMVGVDAIGIGGIVDSLAAIDVTEEAKLLGGVRQGIALMGAIKTVERKLADGSFKHGGQRMMAWCVGNAKVVPTPTAMRIARDEAGLGKIDPLMAAFDAASLMAMNPDTGGSIYDDPEAYAKAFRRERNTIDEGNTWSPEIIADVNHPLFAEHKAKFEKWQARQPNDDD
jgi:phage terminase large subunit-like protein